MAAAEASAGVSEQSGAARLRLMCSHGGRFLPCGPDGAIRYVGGETRVIVVQRDVPFRELAGGKTVPAARYRLSDDDGVLVSVTCDEELSHMREEYDRLRATRPSASFRVFFSGVDVRPRPAAASSSGRPPLAPRMRRVQSEQAIAAPERARVHCGAAPARPPMRRVQSAHEFAGCGRFQPCCYDYYGRHQYYCRCQRLNGHYTPVPAPPMCPPPSMSMNAQEPAPAVSPAKAPGRVVSGVSTEAVMQRSSSDREAEEPNRRAIWEFE